MSIPNRTSLHSYIAIDGGLVYRGVLNMMKSYFYETYKALSFKEGFTLLPTLNHPKSRGFIQLKSRDPFEQPAIVPNYLSEKSDVETLIKGIKECLRIGETYPFKRYGSKFYSRPNPTCTQYHVSFSDGYWECVARHFTYHVYHDVGTCRMGPIDDPNGAVVNERYKIVIYILCRRIIIL